MLEIGHKAPEFRGEGSTIKGVVEGLKHNKIFLTTSGDILDLGAANSIIYLGVIPFARWKVIGIGMYWREASTANEDPVVDFGEYGNPDAYGKMTSAITGGEKFCVTDHQKYESSRLLAPEVITETSATLVTTWAEGIKFNIWRTKANRLFVQEAAVAGMTSGMVMPYFIIEVDTGGKW